MGFAAGSLVHVRGKDWVVLPSKDPDLLMIKPLHGVEEEATGIYLPLGLDSDIRSTVFPPPRADQIGDLSSAKLLYNALRLSFRTGAGPFRSLGRLSFRPRGYQLVPLIMALRQAEDPLRLMIADDVGVGKTIEALLIVRELLDRREIERFAVVCPPHLCEQWRYELSSKFGIEAVIVRSSTQARLDRGVRGDASVFSFYPYQVVSIDYIKSERHRRQFVNECPDLVIVDEAHTCARPSGASETQQQRYRLVREIADRPGQGLMLLTATPHSGKTDEFRSLLGLLDQRYEGWDILTAGEQERRELAERYIQRRRKDVELWQGLHSSERTPFPKRDPQEIPYSLTPLYRRFYERLHAFARALVADATGHEGVRRMRYWSALTLLRGAMSSPASGLEMIRTRTEENAAEGGDDENPLYDREEQGIGDAAAGPLLVRARWSASQRAALNALAEELSGLANLENDAKAKKALEIVSSWVSEGLRPVVFCKFIANGKLPRDALKACSGARVSWHRGGGGDKRGSRRGAQGAGGGHGRLRAQGADRHGLPFGRHQPAGLIFRGLALRPALEPQPSGAEGGQGRQVWTDRSCSQGMPPVWRGQSHRWCRTEGVAEKGPGDQELHRDIHPVPRGFAHPHGRGDAGGPAFGPCAGKGRAVRAGPRSPKAVPS